MDTKLDEQVRGSGELDNTTSTTTRQYIMAEAGTFDVLFSGSSARSTRTLLQVIILCFIAAAAVASRLFSVIRFESIIHEFDPWFNFRATKYLVQHGFYSFWDW